MMAHGVSSEGFTDVQDIVRNKGELGFGKVSTEQRERAGGFEEHRLFTRWRDRRNFQYNYIFLSKISGKLRQRETDITFQWPRHC